MDPMHKNQTKKHNKHRAMEVGGVDVLLAIAANPSEPAESLIPALWTLRNMMHEFGAAKVQFGYRDGIAVLNCVLRQGFQGQYAKQVGVMCHCHRIR
jgi:hypothetical protein